MAGFGEWLAKKAAAKKSLAWIRGKRGPSKRELLREAERIARLRQKTRFEIIQLKRKAAREVEQGLENIAGKHAGQGNDEEMERAHEKLVEEKAYAFGRKTGEITDAAELRQRRRAIRLAVASALRVAGFKDKAQARKIFRLIESLAQPSERSDAKITSRAIGNDLKELLGAKNHAKLLRAIMASIPGVNRVYGIAEAIEQRNKLHASRLLQALENQNEEESE